MFILNQEKQTVSCLARQMEIARMLASAMSEFTDRLMPKYGTKSEALMEEN